MSMICHTEQVRFCAPFLPAVPYADRSLSRPEQSEVNSINKQRFLPELGKLLTFMAEEDRQTALNLYSRCFDDAEDEQQLMDLLVSPTRQAVLIARSYDARERNRQAGGAEEPEQTPAYVLAIDKIYQQVAPRHAQMQVAPTAEPAQEQPFVNQFSLFPDDAHPIDDSEYVPFQIDAEAVTLEEAAEEPAPVRAASQPEEEQESPAPEEAETVPEPEPQAPDWEDFPEQVFEELPVKELVLEPEEQPEPAPAAPAPQPAQAFVFPDLQPAPELRAASAPLSAADYDLDFVPATKRKTRVLLLIVYILLAIPVALIGIVVLLIPTLAALGLAVGVIVLGSAALVAAFSLFQKLADLLILLGTAIIVLALGLLLLWLFVWFIGGAIGGLIRGLIELGRKWCFVEVPA